VTLVVTAAYNDMLTDTAYVVSGSDILPLFKGADWTGVWRTKLIVDDFQPSFGWLRVNAEFDSLTTEEVTLRLYGDGFMYYERVVETKEPVRVPVGRYREWQIEVEGTARVTSVDLATDVLELQD
jgi:hypothetical protein